MPQPMFLSTASFWSPLVATRKSPVLVGVRVDPRTPIDTTASRPTGIAPDAASHVHARGSRHVRMAAADAICGHRKTLGCRDWLGQFRTNRRQTATNSKRPRTSNTVPQTGSDVAPRKSPPRAMMPAMDMPCSRTQAGRSISSWAPVSPCLSVPCPTLGPEVSVDRGEHLIERVTVDIAGEDSANRSDIAGCSGRNVREQDAHVCWVCISGRPSS